MFENTYIDFFFDILIFSNYNKPSNKKTSSNFRGSDADE
jgi:hypothetical protein